ncbi:MAG: alpha/beta hydrolase [Gemmatimonadetes bacterium]|nr:alpha/beta hydrolase [Gemmatimonadota bacterium]
MAGPARSASAATTAVVSRVPTLILSGEMDPITPPRWGSNAAATLVNSRHLVLPHLSHEASGLRGGRLSRYPLRAVSGDGQSRGSADRPHRWHPPPAFVLPPTRP